MVHIKSVELSHFKSFGGTNQVPLLTGFTVISGPNGSGKSNILDALLFCLGLASSKGMRAERLPDLVNHNCLKQKGTSEVSVSVTFDLSDWDGDDFTVMTGETSTENPGEEETETDPELLLKIAQPHTDWTVTRRLRVTKGGNYASNYFINDVPCNVSELHEQLRRLRIYPEGYNVVLQGDVTRIISMNAKERREIIDELAGVAEFDRKIEQVKKTLEEVKEREERCRIIEQELERSLEKLAADRTKAEKYKKLKAQIQEKQQWEKVLLWRSLLAQKDQFQSQLQQGETELQQLDKTLGNVGVKIQTASESLAQLNAKVKALGEDEQISVTSKLATQKLKRTQLQERQQELETLLQQTQSTIEQAGQELMQYGQQFAQINREQEVLEKETLVQRQQECDRTKQQLENYRQQSNELADASQAYVQQQTALTRKINAIQQELNPQRTQQAQLTERYQQLKQKIQDNHQKLQDIDTEIRQQEDSLKQYQSDAVEKQIQFLAQSLADTEKELSLAEQTQTRLLQEQREKQRQLDKLEAKSQAQQEAQGTYATQLILKSNLSGVCGLVAQLAQVEPRYQLALETAAGGRLGYLVVEDDQVGSQGIQFLKEKRAGRATFLPLNKIRPSRIPDHSPLQTYRGFIDFAVKLIDCDPRFKNIFAYVFGTTVVFETLKEARPHIGKARIVTLEGDLLESSGAMTGGSSSSRSSLHFGTAAPEKSNAIETLTTRLGEIETILSRCQEKIRQQTGIAKELNQNLTQARQQQREQELRREQLQKDCDRMTQQKAQLNQQLIDQTEELKTVATRLKTLAKEIPEQETRLATEQAKLTELEASQTSSEWQHIQQEIKTIEQQLQEKDQSLKQAEGRLLELETQGLRLQERMDESKKRGAASRRKLEEYRTHIQSVLQQQGEVGNAIAQTQNLLQQLTEKLGEAKQNRDQAEEKLRQLQDRQQKVTWKQQKLQDTQTERRNTLQTLQERIEHQETQLPYPLPEIPDLVLPEANTREVAFETYQSQLEHLQQDLEKAQKRLEAMEPVNMLALEEYEQTQERLTELTDKVTTLEAERTELLLRIENFTTLRIRAFQEAFDAVNENFQNTFATLSEGDGYLELENKEDPFVGGLNLIAHPKGKPVQRLSSMSGGEKSLTALSFIFALQRYRPSPFYAFDEVDMFLDGANVERLSKMIKQQAEQAQFIVVSLRRPMIEASERTIGVTQARGAYTQVLGIKLA